MSATRIKKPEPCSHEACGSRRFHLGDDGYTYCAKGHQQSDKGAIVAEDTGELVVTGRKARRKDSDAESNISRASTSFSGTRGFEHYLLCLQLVLRKQLKWLVESKNLPNELEALVRDLWALRLQKLQKRVSYDSDTDTEGRSQMFSSQSEGESTDTDATRRSHRRGRIAAAGTPNVLETIALSYIGILILREPVTVADMYSWIMSGEMLYYRASKELPLTMRGRLPATYQDLLEPHILDRPQNLHQLIIDQLSTFDIDFGMAVPEINSPLILYRWVRHLALPVEVFAATQRLTHILDVDFAFSQATKSSSTVALRYPEVKLMVVLVIATKLLFPMDDVERHPTTASDLSALSMDWDIWSKQQTQVEADDESEKPLNFHDALSYSENDILAASNDQLDRYLDWYETNMASEDIREQGRAGQDADFRRSLFRLFPLSGVEARTDNAQGGLQDGKLQTDRLRKIQNALRVNKIIPAHQDDEKRTGSHYHRFRTITDLNAYSRVFYERAAELAAVSLEGMVRGVFAMEGRMLKVEEHMRRGQGG